MQEAGQDMFSASARARTNFAIHYVRGAVATARQVHGIEARYAGNNLGPFFDDVMHLVPATITQCVAGLEAFINERFADGPAVFASQSPDIVDMIWSLVEQKQLLQKFDCAMTLARAAPFDVGAAPYQDVALLIRLRNAIVHFKPEWTDAPKEHAKLARALRSRFAGSPFLPGDPLFPRGYLSYSCAVWAVNSTLQFLAEVQNRLNMQLVVDPSRPEFIIP